MSIQQGRTRPVMSSGASGVPTMIVILLAAGLIMRNVLSSWVVDSIYPYVSPGGSIILKIHPGSYLLGAAGVLSVPYWFRKRAQTSLLRTACVQLIVVVLAILAYGMASGQSTNTSYLLDSIAIAPLTVLALTTFSTQQQLLIFRVGIFILIANAVFVMLQYLTHSHLLPYPWILQNNYFRPSGLFGHPLLVGLIHVSCVPLAFYARFRPAVAWGIALLLTFTVILTSSRVSTIAAFGVIATVVAVRIAMGVQQKRIPGVMVSMIIPVLLLAAAILFAVMLQLGFLDRLLEGLSDESSDTRLDVYGIFQLMTWDQFLFGWNLDLADYYLNEFFGIGGIESPVVLYVINFGLINAVLLGLSILFFFVCLGIKGNMMVRIGVLFFLGIAVTNNVLAAKGPTPTLVSSMLYLAGVLGASKAARGKILPGRSRQVRNPRQWPASGGAPDTGIGERGVAG